MQTRPLSEWVSEWAAEHGMRADVIEEQARRHLEDLGELDGIERG